MKITYYDKQKNQIPYSVFKEQWWGYVKFDDVILFKKEKYFLDLPFINLRIDDWNIVWIVAEPDVIKYINKNISNVAWQKIWYIRIKADQYFKLWQWQENKKIKNYWYTIDADNQITKIEAKRFATAMKFLQNDIDFQSEQWLLLKQEIEEKLNPSDVVYDLIPAEEHAKIKKQILFSDDLKLILDLTKIRGNRSWSIFNFIFRALGGDLNKIKEYLKSKWFDVDVYVEDSDILFLYKFDDNTQIEFRTDWVFIRLMVGWQETEQILLTKPIKLKSFFKSMYSLKEKILTDKEWKYFMIDVNDKTEIIWYVKNPDTFNSNFWHFWLRWIGSNKQLQIFYEALEKWAEEKKDLMVDYKIVLENKFDLDEKIFVHWWEIIWDESGAEIINMAPKYATNFNKQQITLEEAIEILDGYYKKPWHYIVLLWLLGAFLKKEFKKYWINIPLILASWITRSWKTELITLIMKLFGFEDKSWKTKNWEEIPKRIIALELAKPHWLLTQLTEEVPVFLDELTGDVNKEVDSILRAIFNEQTVPKGKAGLWVKKYIIKSPVIVGGEKLPMKPSVVNRSIYLFFSSYYKVDKNTYRYIRETLKDKIILEDFVKKAKQNIHRIPEIIKETIELEESRVDQSLNFIFWINKLFNLFPDDVLIWRLQEIYKTEVRLLQWLDEEKHFFNKLCYLNLRQKIYWFEDWWDGLIISLYIPEDLSKEYQHYVIRLKEIVWDETIDGDMLNINMDKLFEEKDRNKLWIVQKIIRFFRWVKDVVWQNWLDEKFQGRISF